MNWRENLKGLGLACSIFILFVLLIHVADEKQAIAEHNRLQQHTAVCEYILHRMPTTADSIDAMVMVNECDYTNVSLLPFVRGDALRDLPEQR